MSYGEMSVFDYEEKCGCKIGWALGWDDEEEPLSFCLSLQRFEENGCTEKHDEADDFMALNIYLTKEELEKGINSIIREAKLEVNK